MSRFKIIGQHLSAWIFYLLILLLGTDNAGFLFWSNTIGTLVAVCLLFYVNIGWLFPKYLFTQKFIPLIIFLILLNLAAIFLRLLLTTLFQEKSFNNFISNIFSPVLFWNQFRVNLLFIGVSVLPIGSLKKVTNRNKINNAWKKKYWTHV